MVAAALVAAALVSLAVSTNVIAALPPAFRNSQSDAIRIALLAIAIAVPQRLEIRLPDLGMGERGTPALSAAPPVRLRAGGVLGIFAGG